MVEAGLEIAVDDSEMPDLYQTPAQAGSMKIIPRQSARTIQSPLGEYTLLEPIGRGGLAKTFKAAFTSTDGNTQEIVCLKRFLFGDTSDYLTGEGKKQELFRREGEVLPILNHPTFPSFRESFSSQTDIGDTQQWIAMEYIPGKTLREKQEELSLEQKIAIIDTLLVAAEHLHENGFYHRDIKPDNVIVQEDGLVRLVDLNSVALRDDPRTFGSTIAGTSGYAPIEQFQPMRDQKDFAPADVYGIGATLCFLLDGKDPERVEDIDHLTISPRHPQELRDLIQAMTWNVQRKKRIQTACEARKQLSSILEKEKEEEKKNDKKIVLQEERAMVEYKSVSIQNRMIGRSVLIPFRICKTGYDLERGIVGGSFILNGVSSFAASFIGSIVTSMYLSDSLIAPFWGAVTNVVGVLGINIIDACVDMYKERGKKAEILEVVDFPSLHTSGKQDYAVKEIKKIVQIAVLGEGDLEATIDSFLGEMKRRTGICDGIVIPSSHFDNLRIEYAKNRLENGLVHTHKELKAAQKEAKLGKREAVEKRIGELEAYCSERRIAVPEEEYISLRKKAFEVRYKTQLAIVEKPVKELTKKVWEEKWTLASEEQLATHARALCAAKGISLADEVEAQIRNEWKERVRNHIVGSIRKIEEQYCSSYDFSYSSGSSAVNCYIDAGKDIRRLRDTVNELNIPLQDEIRECEKKARQGAIAYVTKHTSSAGVFEEAEEVIGAYGFIMDFEMRKIIDTE